jgi:hypothetical protein
MLGVGCHVQEGVPELRTPRWRREFGPPHDVLDYEGEPDEAGDVLLCW